MIYHLDKIKEMAEGDEEFILSVIAVYLEEVPADLHDLEAAIGATHYEQIYKLAHKIKPNVDLLGMERARATALEIETQGKNEGNIARIREIFPILKGDVEQSIAELRHDFEL